MINNKQEQEISFQSFDDLLEYVKSNETIYKSFIKAKYLIESFNNPCCSISGGKDSDIMLDIITRVDKDKKVKYIWFDTGIEYQATKQHLKYLEQKYGIKIHREKAIKPIPLSCKEYGQPFLSKHVSEMIYRLQKHNFQWEDESFDVLIKKYPKCKSALLWWTNGKSDNESKIIQFDINQNKYLKDYIINNPPKFKISNKCCEYAKKKVAHNLYQYYNSDLHIVGVRRIEGGVRSTAYKDCFSNNQIKNKPSNYRPLFWYLNDDELLYDELFHITHSDCYSVYGLNRTGCVGCPYNKKLDMEIAVMEQYEPKLAIAAKNVFRDSYEYTKQYREFCKQMKNKKI